MPENRENETYQFFFLKKALLEVTDTIDNIEFDEKHFEGMNVIGDFIVPVTFPKYLLEYISTIDKPKTIKYNFIGNILENRKWVSKFKSQTSSWIKESSSGSDATRKFKLDTFYYKIVSRSKFTLCPIGDCPWSYRLFEAIMCLSIPIVERGSPDIFVKNYNFFYDDEVHVYDFYKAMENYNKFVKSMHFLENNQPLIDFLKS